MQGEPIHEDSDFIPVPKLKSKIFEEFKMVSFLDGLWTSHPVDQSSRVHQPSDGDIGRRPLEIDDDILALTTPSCLHEILRAKAALVMPKDFNLVSVTVLQIDLELSLLFCSLNQEMGW